LIVVQFEMLILLGLATKSRERKIVICRADLEKHSRQFARFASGGVLPQSKKTPKEK